MEEPQKYPRHIQIRIGVVSMAITISCIAGILYLNNLRSTLPQVNEVTRTCSQDEARKQSILATRGPEGMPDDFGMHRMYTTPDRSTIFFWYCNPELKPVLDGMRKGEQWFSRETVASDKELVSNFERLLFLTWRADRTARTE